MINREWQTVHVLTYSDEVDDYGQKRQGEFTSRDVEMVCKIYSQTNVTDPRYIDVDVIGLTYDKNITDKNVIIIGDDRFNVKYVIPSSRLIQILMTKC